MNRPALTDTQILLLLDICLDAEQRCDEREKFARAVGHVQKAEYVVQLREQYASMRQAFLEEIKRAGMNTREQHQKLHPLPESASQRLGQSGP